MNWNALTSISTFLMMIATFWIAIIALQAKNSWKSELKERKKLSSLRDTNTLLNKIYSHLSILKFIQNFNSQEEEYHYLTELHDMLAELPDIQEELNFINYKEFSNILISIIQKGNNCPVFQEALTKSKLINISMQEKQKLEFETLINNYADLMNLIENAKKICNNEIQKFYNK